MGRHLLTCAAHTTERQAAPRTCGQATRPGYQQATRAARGAAPSSRLLPACPQWACACRHPSAGPARPHPRRIFQHGVRLVRGQWQQRVGVRAQALHQRLGPVAGSLEEESAAARGGAGGVHGHDVKKLGCNRPGSVHYSWRRLGRCRRHSAARCGGPAASHLRRASRCSRTLNSSKNSLGREESGSARVVGSCSQATNTHRTPNQAAAAQ